VVPAVECGSVGGGVGCGSPEKWRRVTESVIVDRIDRVTGSTFGFAEKSPPEKFSDGGSVMVAGGIYDMYNNLKVFEADIKGTYGSSSNSQNVAFVSTESTSCTNELNAAYSVSTATRHSSQAQGSSSYIDELMFSFFANQSSSPQLDNEDLEDCRTARNPGNMGRDAGNAGYRGRDNGKGLQERRMKKYCAKVKTGLGYDSQFNEKDVLDVKYEEVTETVFDNRLSDEENSLANDRFKKGEGFRAVPPLLTRNYMPPNPDLSFARLDDSIYKFKISETFTSLSKDVKDAPKTSIAFREKPKEVRTSAPLIQD
nr:hypothetical protein [Tanacetum cinerariifolium]